MNGNGKVKMLAIKGLKRTSSGRTTQPTRTQLCEHAHSPQTGNTGLIIKAPEVAQHSYSNRNSISLSHEIKDACFAVPLRLELPTATATSNAAATLFIISTLNLTNFY